MIDIENIKKDIMERLKFQSIISFGLYTYKISYEYNDIDLEVNFLYLGQYEEIKC